MKKEKWIKLPPYKGKPFQGCANCKPIERIADLNMIIAVGFGIAQVQKNGKVIYSEPVNPKSENDFKTLKEIEAKAQKDPDNDYRLILNAPLRNNEYQRQGKNKWVLINSGIGFA